MRRSPVQSQFGTPILSRQKPYDTFWGSRFAIVGDPDGYQIGLMSPVDADKRYWPPADAPASD